VSFLRRCGRRREVTYPPLPEPPRWLDGHYSAYLRKLRTHWMICARAARLAMGKALDEHARRNRYRELAVAIRHARNINRELVGVIARRRPRRI
jgi:hypothetical protein